MFDELRQAVLAAVALHAGAAVIALELKDWEGWGQLDRDERQMPEWSKWEAITGDGSEWLVMFTYRRFARPGGGIALPYEDGEMLLSTVKKRVWPGFTSASGKRAWEIPGEEALAEYAT